MTVASDIKAIITLKKFHVTYSSYMESYEIGSFKKN